MTEQDAEYDARHEERFSTKAAPAADDAGIYDIMCCRECFIIHVRSHA
jgi:hypothetical protein